MNNLIITKNDWVDDYILNLANLGEFSVPSKEVIESCQGVLEIMSNNPSKKTFKLIFPERFYPRNSSDVFWKKIKDLMKLGISFEVKTSDILAGGRIPKKSENDIVGWDSVKIIFPDKTESVNPKLYGRDTESLFSIKF